MDERSKQLRRWAELMDRQAAGEALTPEELAFCDRFAEEHPACQREMSLYRELADLDAPPELGTRALVDGALQRLAQHSADADADSEAEARASESRPITRGRRSRRLWSAALAATVAAVAALAVFTTSDERTPTARESAPDTPVAHSEYTLHAGRVELVYVSGQVQVDGQPVLISSALLPEGSEVAVESGGACIAMDPGIDLCLAEHTRLRLTATDRADRRLDLLEGKVGVQLLPQPPGSRLSIVAGGVWSTAVGTAFTVERSERASVATTVLSGKVRVGGGQDDARLLAAHQRAKVHGEKSEVVAVSRSDEAPEWALLGPARLWRSPLSSTLELATSFPAGAELVLDGQLIGIAPLSSLVPVGTHQLDVRIDGEVRMRRDFVAQAGEILRLSFEPTSWDQAEAEAEDGNDRMAAPRATVAASGRALPAEPSEAPEGMSVKPAALLGEARQLMRSGDFYRAAERYAELRRSHPTSPEARAALVSLAQLELDRLGQPRRALSNLDRYLAEHGGELSQEARHARIRALRELGEPELERTAIEEYLELYPRSFQAEPLARRLSELRQAP